MAKKPDELARLQAEVAALSAKLAAATQREPLPWGIDVARTYTRAEFMAILDISDKTWQRLLKRGLPYTPQGGVSGRLYQVWSEAWRMVESCVTNVSCLPAEGNADETPPQHRN